MIESADGPQGRVLRCTGPAAEWSEGSAPRCRATRGGLTVDELAWSGGAPTSVRITARTAARCTVRFRDRSGAEQRRPLALAAGEAAVIRC